MYTTAEILDVDKIKVSITITQTIGEWRKLKEQLISSQWPACDLTQQIRDVIRKVEGTYLVTESPDNG